MKPDQLYFQMLKDREGAYYRSLKPWWRARCKRYWDKQPGYGRKNIVKVLEAEAKRLTA